MAAVLSDGLLAWSTALLDALDGWYRDGLDTSGLAPFGTALVRPVVLALSLVLLAVRWYRARAGGQLVGAARVGNVLLIMVVLVLVAGHLLASGVSALAATRPSQVGWLAAAGGFLVAVAAAINLTLHLLDTLHDFATDGGFSWRTGLLAWPVGLVTLLLVGWLVPWATVLVVAALGASQLLQVGFAVRALEATGQPVAAVVAVVVYLLGTISVAMLWLVLLHLLVPMTFVVGLLLALTAREGVTTARPPRRRTCEKCHCQLSESEAMSLRDNMSGRLCSYCRSWEEKRLRGEM